MLPPWASRREAIGGNWQPIGGGGGGRLVRGGSSLCLPGPESPLLQLPSKLISLTHND